MAGAEAARGGKERWKTEYKARELQERQAFFLSLAQQPEGGGAGAEEEALTSEWRRLYEAQRARERGRRRVSEFEVVRRWRAVHALDDAPDAAHGSLCAFPRCRLVQLTPDLYICRASHRVHHCSPACLDTGGEGDGRCAVSGRWPTSLDTSILSLTGDDGDEEEDGEGRGDGTRLGEEFTGQEALDADGLSLFASFVRGYEDGDAAWAHADDEGRDAQKEEDWAIVEEDDGGVEEARQPTRGALRSARRLCTAKRRRKAVVYPSG